MSMLIENPFLNNKNKNIFTTYSGETVELDQTNVAKYFKHIYILAKRNNQTISPDFYNWEISKELLEEINPYLLIQKVSVKVLKNKKHFDSMVMLSDSQLKPYNIFNYELGPQNIVVPILNIAYQNLLQYVEQYESNDKLENIYKIKVLNSFFGLEQDNYKANEFICQMINNLEESKYWTNYYNCLLNISNKFKNRKFHFQINRICDRNVADILKTITEPDLVKTKNSNYIKDIELDKPKNYVDVASIIDKKGYSYYRIAGPCDFTKSDIVQLFSVLNEKQQFLLFANLTASKKYCHLVINNELILKLMKPTILKFAPLFRYIISYAWIRFYSEECIKKTFIKKTDEFVFDINTASQLPVFPFDHTEPKKNPYMPILISDSELNPKENICGIPDYTGELTNQGICNLDEFRNRVNIFCTNDPNKNLFDGFDFEKNQVAISGSIMSACLQKYHPLMSRFKANSLTEKFVNFFNEYYAKSDIDVMFKFKDNIAYIDAVKEFHNQIVLNVCKFNAPYAEPGHIKLVPKKLAYLFVSEDFINKNIHIDSTEPIDKVKYIMDNIYNEKIKELFKPYYESLKVEKYNEMTNGFDDESIQKLKMKYPEIFNMEDVEFRVYVNKKLTTQIVEQPKESNGLDLDDDSPSEKFTEVKIIKDIDLVFTYKFKIDSPHLNHSFELFNVNYDDFFSVVGRFHLPCVRGYYDGSNVYMTPSCISAHLTFMNLDYKYVTGTTDPIVIINKNRMRGWGTWLNSNEKKFFAKYSKEVPFWRNLYSIDSKTSDNDTNKAISGTLSLNHKLFRPRLYNMDDFVESSYVDTSDRYNDKSLDKTVQDQKNASEQVIKRFDSIDIKEINYNKFVAIDSNGYITPLQKWIINTTWDLYQHNYKHLIKKSEVTEPKPQKESKWGDSDEEEEPIPKKKTMVL